MFCHECGEELELLNQRFCHNCGSKIAIKIKSPKVSKTSDDEPTLENINLIDEQKKIVKQQEGDISYAKKCLGYSLTSIITAGFGIYLLMFIVIFHFVNLNTSPPVFFTANFPFEVFAIINVGIHVIGLIFGFKSKVIHKKAEIFEPKRTAQKIGGVLGIFAIIANIIGIIVSIIFIPIMYYNLFPNLHFT